MPECAFKEGDRVSTDFGARYGTIVATFCDGAIARVNWDRPLGRPDLTTDIGAIVLQQETEGLPCDIHRKIHCVRCGHA